MIPRFLRSAANQTRSTCNQSGTHPRRQLWQNVGLMIALTAAGTSAIAGMTHIFPGPKPNGTGITPQGWRVTPAGKQTDLGNGPIGIAASPDESMVLVANAGYKKNSLMVINPRSGAVTQTLLSEGRAQNVSG